MVHADEHIALFVQQLHRILQNVQLLFAGRHGIGVDTALRFENVRQMRVMIQRDTVGIQRVQHRVQRRLDAVHRLVRQAVNQIHADGFEARIARRFNHILRFFHRLDTVHGSLHFRVEILNAHAHAVKAQLRQFEHAFTAHFARVDFDGIFAVRHQLEMFANHAEHAFQLLIAQERGRAAAEMQLRQFVPAVQVRFQQRHFLFQISQIFIGFSGVFGDDFVAAAVIANHVAKRDVHIQRHGFFVAVQRVVQNLDIFGLAEAVVKTVGRGVGCVTRAVGRQAGNQLAVENKILSRCDR